MPPKNKYMVFKQKPRTEEELNADAIALYKQASILTDMVNKIEKSINEQNLKQAQQPQQVVYERAPRNYAGNKLTTQTGLSDRRKEVRPHFKEPKTTKTAVNQVNRDIQTVDNVTEFKIPTVGQLLPGIEKKSPKALYNDKINIAITHDYFIDLADAANQLEEVAISQAVESAKYLNTIDTYTQTDETYKQRIVKYHETLQRQEPRKDKMAKELGLTDRQAHNLSYQQVLRLYKERLLEPRQRAHEELKYAFEPTKQRKQELIQHSQSNYFTQNAALRPVQ